MKQLVVLVEQKQYDWIKQLAKTQKSQMGPIVRGMFEFLSTYSSKELSVKLSKSRIESELEVANQKAQQAIKEKERLEKELETINA